jgi:signal transduction histidine kinase
MRSALTEYQEGYQREGMTGIEREVAEKKSNPAERPLLLVRVATATNTTLFLDSPPSWRKKFDLRQLEKTGVQAAQQLLRIPATDGDEEVLEVVSAPFPDGTLLQVGKSTKERENLLERFRETFVGVMLPMLILSVTGGALLTLRALRPLRGLIHTLDAIIATGALATRAAVPDTRDELAELSRLFNAMLERIGLLISGMQSTLDNVAHDLRTPMTRLRGMAEIALQTEMPETALREALATCIEESDRILAMLNTLMDISEAEHGAMRLERESLNAQELITQAVELYRDVAEDKGIHISTAVPSALFFSADRNRMLQVIANLLDNAIKYTPLGGQVTITIAQNHHQVVLTVTDTGVGIPPEDLPHIWNRLYRGDKSRSQRGLGLGLSLVKAIVRAHSGSVTVHSTSGNGTVFTLTLPLLPLPCV